MDPFARAFIRSSLLWFVGGITLGLVMALEPGWIVYRPAHAHMNVAGFVVHMIFGVGYQMLPRFFGHPIHSRRLAVAHVWLANLGLAVLVAGFLLTPRLGSAAMPLTAGGGALWVAGAYGFVYNLWRTFNAADRRRRDREDNPPPRVLPTRGDE